MKEPNHEGTEKKVFRKSPWRFAFLAAGVFGLWGLLQPLAAKALYLVLRDPVLLTKHAASIGIIGGADGPTAIFVTGQSPAVRWLSLLLVVIGVLGYLRLGRCRPED